MFTCCGHHSAVPSLCSLAGAKMAVVGVELHRLSKEDSPTPSLECRVQTGTLERKRKTLEEKTCVVGVDSRKRGAGVNMRCSSLIGRPPQPMTELPCCPFIKPRGH
ncbi:unnamed protein product [Pleuronectes platessa]|uniref:Uncharacterized protein n=1 Tax=Pleuronectes platessa TaxID=8262 RepID=A0A9N7TI17_PLEPL|nr:unnamed protein product [Pleuronectes platessa]